MIVLFISQHQFADALAVAGRGPSRRSWHCPQRRRRRRRRRTCQTPPATGLVWVASSLSSRGELDSGSVTRDPGGSLRRRSPSPSPSWLAVMVFRTLSRRPAGGPDWLLPVTIDSETPTATITMTRTRTMPGPARLSQGPLSRVARPGAIGSPQPGSVPEYDSRCRRTAAGSANRRLSGTR